MPPGRFRHLIDAATFSDDVVVKVGTDRSEAWVSEQLLDRLLNLGRAYRLHVLTLLADIRGHEATWINRQQAEALIEEVEFVASLVDDSAVSELVATLLSLVAEAACHGDGNALVIEGP